MVRQHTGLRRAFKLNCSTEIARLQNSIQHLKRSNAELEEAKAEDPDPVFDEALQENRDVMYAVSVFLSMLS